MNEMYFNPRGEYDLPGKHHDEHDNLAGQPKEVQRDKIRRDNEKRRQDKAKTTGRSTHATNKDGKGQR